MESVFGTMIAWDTSYALRFGNQCFETYAGEYIEIVFRGYFGVFLKIVASLAFEIRKVRIGLIGYIESTLETYRFNRNSVLINVEGIQSI